MQGLLAIRRSSTGETENHPQHTQRRFDGRRRQPLRSKIIHPCPHGRCLNFADQRCVPHVDETRRRPIDALAEERTRLHRLPHRPFTVAFGTTRRVNWDATVSVEGVRYSVPHTLADTRVWVRFHGDELIVTAVGDSGPVEVARHRRSTPGNPSIKAEHYPPRRDHHGERIPRATSPEETAFLALGPGAASWLIEAAATGTRRIRPKMAEAVTLAKLHPPAEIDRALGIAAVAGRFAEDDLIAIVTHHAGRQAAEPTRTGEGHSLQPGTSAWSQFGLPLAVEPDEDHR